MFNSGKIDAKSTQIKAEVLLSEPSSGYDGIEESERLERASSSYSNQSERFRLKEREFRRQYAQLYAVRLMTMRKKLAAAARRTWGEFKHFHFWFKSMTFLGVNLLKFFLIFRKLIAHQEVI